MFNSHYINRVIHILISLSVLQLASFFKVSYIIGSKITFFSAADFVSPLVGAFGSWGLVISAFSLRSLAFGAYPWLHIFKHLPTCVGALYWSTQSFIIRCMLPTLCILLFVIHPTGSQAYVYSFYWLIPIVLYAINAQGIMAQALGSTFVTHAVGSVIWLYTVPMTAELWLGLIPVVAVERLVAAVAMTVIYKMSEYIVVYTKKAWFTKAYEL